MITRVVQWWREQTNRVYRCVLVFLGLDCVVVGVAEANSLYLWIGAIFIAGAIFWD